VLGHESLCVSGAGVCGMDVVTKTPQIQIPVVNSIRVRDLITLSQVTLQPAHICLYIVSAIAPLPNTNTTRSNILLV
jgi:hypothetical protein